MADLPIKSKKFTASQMGWLRRKDQHPNAWELPCGCMYVHWSSNEPLVAVLEIPTAAPPPEAEGPAA
jgi:hypothetical protein